MNITEGEHLMVAYAIAGIGSVGLAANLVLYQKISKQREQNNLLMYLMIMNVGLIVIDFPFPVISSFASKWAFSSQMCTFYGASSLVFGFSIMLSVLMLCLDMIFQKKYDNYDTFKSKVRNFMIAYMLFNSLFWGLAPAFGWSQIAQELTKTSCTVDFVNADKLYYTYIVSCFVLQFAGPILIMLYCLFTDDSNENTQEKIDRNNDFKNKMFSLISMFIIVWTPYAICYMWPLFSDIKNLSVKFNAAAPVIAKLCVITTPLVYIADQQKEEETKKSQ